MKNKAIDKVWEKLFQTNVIISLIVGIFSIIGGIYSCSRYFDQRDDEEVYLLPKIEHSYVKTGSVKLYLKFPQLEYDRSINLIEYYTKKEKYDSLYNEKGVVALKYNKDTLKALEYFQHAIKENPHFDWPFYNCGFIYSLKEKYNLSSSAYKKALLLKSVDSVDIYKKLAINYLASNLNDSARVYLNKFLVNKGDDSYGNYLYGALEFNENNLKNGIKYLSIALEKDQYDTLSLVLLSDIKKDQGEYDIALKLLDKALIKKNDSISVYKKKANIHLEIGGIDNEKEAFDLFEAIIEQKEDALAFSSIGYLYFKNKQFKEAIEYFKLELKSCQDSSLVYRKIGNAHRILEENTEAILSYKKSLELKKHANTYNKLGLMLSDENRIPEALNCFKEALKIDRDIYYYTNLVGYHILLYIVHYLTGLGTLFVIFALYWKRKKLKYFISLQLNKIKQST